MRFRTSLGVLAFAFTIALQAQSVPPQIGGTLPGPLPFFPADNWWNQDISAAPVDLNSSAFISFIGTNRLLHPDFGGLASPSTVKIYGFPYVVVSGDQPKRTVQFDYADESDGVNHETGASFDFYPIPDEAKTQQHWIEGGEPGNQTPGGDRHMLIVDRDARRLYELFDLSWSGTGWRAGSGAFFDLNSNGRRDEGWTSADAAGLPILPGLVRYDEVVGAAEIGHAFRVTVRATNGYVWPASHRAGTTSGALPMGARLRLKSTFDLSGFAPPLQKIFRAMKRYGLIVADNGSDMYISGTFDTGWNNDVLNPAFEQLSAGDFEVVELGWGGGCAGPSAPQTLSSNVTGQLVRLAWGAPATGDQTEYVLEAGSATTLTNIASYILPNIPSLSVMAPAGNYYVRARARSACGTSTPSNEILVTVAGCAPPAAPAAFAFSKSGNVVTLTWNPAAGAGDYVIEVGSVSGSSNILVTALPGSPISATAPPGTYFARLRGRNACGISGMSNEIVVVM